MKKILILPITVFLAFLIACSNGPINRTLNEADRLVFTHPDSAIILLEGIDSANCNRSQRARLSLLIGKAYSKAKRLYPDYSRLETAINHYNGHNDSMEMQSNYYYGLSLRQHSHPAEAISYLLEAFELAKKHGDNFYAALISRNIFFAYQDLYMADSSAAWAPKEKEFIVKTNNPEYINWADATLIEGLMDAGNYQACLDSIDRVDEAFMKKNTSFRHQILKFKAEALDNVGRPQEAIDCYAGLLADGASLNSKEWTGLAEMLLLSGNTRDAEDCLENGLELAENTSDSIAYWKVKGILSENQGDLKKTIYYTKLWGETLAQDNNEDIINPKITIFSKYIENQLQEKKKELQTNRRWVYSLIGLISLLVLVIILIFCLFYYKQKTQNTEIQYLQQTLDRLNGELEKYGPGSSIAEEKIQPHHSDKNHIKSDILRHYAELIDNVSEFYFLRIKNDSIRKNLKFTENIKKFIKSLEDGEILNQLIEYSDTYDDNWASNLKEICPSINQKEVGLLLCERLNISNEASHILLNYKKGTLYNARYVAKRKLKESGISNQKIQQILDLNS